MNYQVLLLLAAYSCQVVYGVNVLERAEEKLFGDVDARQEYRAMVHEALREMGVKNFLEVPVKRMNSVASTFIGEELISFTGFGIWINESLLDACSPEEKKFQIYHEAAHYGLWHHQRVVLLGAISFGMPFLGRQFLKRSYSAKSFIRSFVGLVYLASPLLFAALLPTLVRHNEKEADLIAASALIQAGKGDIVAHHRAQLQVIAEQHDNSLSRWWFSPQDQIAYFDRIIVSSAD